MSLITKNQRVCGPEKLMEDGRYRFVTNNGVYIFLNKEEIEDMYINVCIYEELLGDVVGTDDDLHSSEQGSIPWSSTN